MLNCITEHNTISATGGTLADLKMDTQKTVSYPSSISKGSRGFDNLASRSRLRGGGVLMTSLVERAGEVGTREGLGIGWQEGLADTGRNSFIKRRCVLRSDFPDCPNLKRPYVYLELNCGPQCKQRVLGKLLHFICFNY